MAILGFIYLPYISYGVHILLMELDLAKIWLLGPSKATLAKNILLFYWKIEKKKCKPHTQWGSQKSESQLLIA